MVLKGHALGAGLGKESARQRWWAWQPWGPGVGCGTGSCHVYVPPSGDTRNTQDTSHFVSSAWSWASSGAGWLPRTSPHLPAWNTWLSGRGPGTSLLGLVSWRRPPKCSKPPPSSPCSKPRAARTLVLWLLALSRDPGDTLAWGTCLLGGEFNLGWELQFLSVHSFHPHLPYCSAFDGLEVNSKMQSRQRVPGALTVIQPPPHIL